MAHGSQHVNRSGTGNQLNIDHARRTERKRERERERTTESAVQLKKETRPLWAPINLLQPGQTFLWPLTALGRSGCCLPIGRAVCAPVPELFEERLCRGPYRSPALTKLTFPAGHIPSGARAAQCVGLGQSRARDPFRAASDAPYYAAYIMYTVEQRRPASAAERLCCVRVCR